MSTGSKPHSAPRPTATVEDYLASIYGLERDGQAVIAAHLAEALAVTPPTVTVTLQRMERDGWITTKGRKGIQLTKAGRDAARSVVRRHMLTEWLLTRVLKIPWSKAHAEAHQMEHTISEATEAQMRANLDDPQVCPHGNPLPGYEQVAAAWIPLTDAEAGSRVVIRRIHESAEADAQLLEFLEANAIAPGVRAEVVEILPFNETVTLKLGDRRLALGFSAARRIFVEKT
jgi:DtxR family transcriptional regulator, Mn-dependent transcriptional regulator